MTMDASVVIDNLATFEQTFNKGAGMAKGRAVAIVLDEALADAF